MSLSLTDAQLTMLRLARRHLALPTGHDGGLTAGSGLSALVDFGLIEPHDGGFRITASGEQLLRQVPAGRSTSAT